MLIDRMKAMPGHLVRRAQQISTAAFSEEMGECDLTAVQFAALVAISEIPNLDATRLSELIFFDRATIGDVIARLERKGLVSRRPGEHDRRTKVLAVTPAAEPLITAGVRRVEAAQERLLTGLDECERETFMTLLNKLVARADVIELKKVG